MNNLIDCHVLSLQLVKNLTLLVVFERGLKTWEDGREILQSVELGGDTAGTCPRTKGDYFVFTY